MRSLADLGRGLRPVCSVPHDHSAAGRDEVALVDAGQLIAARTEPHLRSSLSVDRVLDRSGEDRSARRDAVVIQVGWYRLARCWVRHKCQTPGPGPDIDQQSPTDNHESIVSQTAAFARAPTANLPD